MILDDAVAAASRRSCHWRTVDPTCPTLKTHCVPHCVLIDHDDHDDHDDHERDEDLW